VALASLALTPADVVVDQTVNGVVTLTGPAPASGAQVTLSSSTPGIAQIPQSVSVPADQVSVGFAGTATNPGQTTVTATLDTSSASAVLTVSAAKSVEKVTDKVSDKVALEKVRDKVVREL
jgi:hypothetical protein